jgi:hypothetical protein
MAKFLNLRKFSAAIGSEVSGDRFCFFSLFPLIPNTSLPSEPFHYANLRRFFSRSNRALPFPPGANQRFWLAAFRKTARGHPGQVELRRGADAYSLRHRRTPTRLSGREECDKRMGECKVFTAAGERESPSRKTSLGTVSSRMNELACPRKTKQLSQYCG